MFNTAHRVGTIISSRDIIMGSGRLQYLSCDCSDFPLGNTAFSVYATVLHSLVGPQIHSASLPLSCLLCAEDTEVSRMLCQPDISKKSQQNVTQGYDRAMRRGCLLRKRKLSREKRQRAVSTRLCSW